MKRSLALITALSLLLSPPAARAAGAEYFVAGNGRDSNPGTSAEEPFRTIGRAAQVLQPGDTCWIREGVYRETVRITLSGREDRPITFARYRDERVIVDGADVVAGQWTEDKSGIWRAKVAASGPIEAVFCDGRMMVEARWPNCSWEQNWDVERKWALTSKGSKLGVIECPALGSSRQDLSGGLLYLKLSKGNNIGTQQMRPPVLRLIERSHNKRLSPKCARLGAGRNAGSPGRRKTPLRRWLAVVCGHYGVDGGFPGAHEALVVLESLLPGHRDVMAREPFWAIVPRSAGRAARKDPLFSVGRVQGQRSGDTVLRQRPLHLTPAFRQHLPHNGGFSDASFGGEADRVFLQFPPNLLNR